MNQTTPLRADDDIIDEDVLHALLEALTPVAIPGDVDARLRQKVMLVTSAEAKSPAFVTVRAEEGKWVNIAPNVDIKILLDDASCRTMLYRFAPGGELPAHPHRGHEECIVLQGELRLGDVHVKQGDYHLAPSGSAHGKIISDTGALIFVRNVRETRVAEV